MLERGELFSRYDWPRPTVAGLVTVAWWIAGIIAAAATIRWIVNRYDTRVRIAKAAAHRAGAVTGSQSILSTPGRLQNP